MAGVELLDDDFDDCASVTSFQSCASRARRQRAVVKNTFVDIIDDNGFGNDGRCMRRSLSDSDLSSAGDDRDDTLGYWLPSLSSQSSAQSHRRDEFHWIGDKPSWVTPGQRTDGRGGELIIDANDEDFDGPVLNANNLKRHDGRTMKNGPLAQMLVQQQVPFVPTGEGADFIQSVFDELEGKEPMEKLQELYDEGQLQLIPRDEKGVLTSVGAIKHDCGECFSCAYWFKGLCKYGISCGYCHMVHPGQKGKRLRPSRQTRLRMKKHEARKAAEEAEAEGGATLLDTDDEGNPLALQPMPMPAIGDDFLPVNLQGGRSVML